MRSIENAEKIEKLCNRFSLLDEEDQKQVFGVFEGLLFAKLKMDMEENNEYSARWNY